MNPVSAIKKIADNILEIHGAPPPENIANLDVVLKFRGFRENYGVDFSISREADGSIILEINHQGELVIDPNDLTEATEPDFIRVHLDLARRLEDTLTMPTP